jgi:thiosulfate/3-mercaptopyruvate sulfurtransferase
MPVRSQPWKVLVLLASLALIVGCASPTPEPDPTPTPEVTMDSLVTAEWLSAHLDDPDLVVLDCTVQVVPDPEAEIGFRIENGRETYDAGHIPGAGFADLMGELSDADSPYKFAVLEPEEFAAVMGALGVGDDSRVVLYDDSHSGWAARVWWMLRWVGFDRAALLDGGLDAWKADGHPLSTEPADRPAKTLTPSPRPELIADRDEVLAAIEDPNVVLIDALSEQVFRGEMAIYGRPGHIPTASNVPSLSLLAESGRFKPMAELAAMFESVGDGRVITYCGGGIAASADAFVMTRLGFDDVAVYTASLQEWAADPENPMVDETP